MKVILLKKIIYHCDYLRSSKGLEFEQVVLFVSDYRLSSEEDVYNHYVAATRAKTKLILVYVNGEWSARPNLQRI